jgi:hypothetical protein
MPPLNCADHARLRKRSGSESVALSIPRWQVGVEENGLAQNESSNLQDPPLQRLQAPRQYRI